MALVVLERLERVLVALVQQEQLAVGEHLIDELIEQLRPGRCRLGSSPSCVELIEQLAPELVQPQVQLEEDVLLALEVVVERRLGDAEPLGDLAQRRLVVALLVEELERDVEDPLARLAARPAAGLGLVSVVLGSSMLNVSLLDDRQVSGYAEP